MKQHIRPSVLFFLTYNITTMSFLLVLLVIAFPLLALSFAIVNQGTVAVVTIFGKYQRIMTPGLNFKIPFVEAIFKKISIQSRSIELEFPQSTENYLT